MTSKNVLQDITYVENILIALIFVRYNVYKEILTAKNFQFNSIHLYNDRTFWFSDLLQLHISTEQNSLRITPTTCETVV